MEIREVLDAIDFELQKTATPVWLKIASVVNRGKIVDVVIDSDESSQELDDSLEECTAWWRSGVHATVAAVIPSENKISLRNLSGALPAQGVAIRLYPIKYLRKLEEIWQHPGRAAAALNVLRRMQEPQAPLPETAESAYFPKLRPRQRQALALLDRTVGYLWGPPGTGKTYTLGAMVATILLEQPRARVLLLSSTNRAVDGALVSVDKRLEELRLRVPASIALRKRIRRYGANFGAALFEREKRTHLVVDTNRQEIVAKLAKLQESVPEKSDSLAYVRWKDEIEALKNQIPRPDPKAALLAMTTTAAAFAYEHLERNPFDYVIFDEASQISLPYSCALGSLGRKLIFTGDPKQLAPIVVSDHPSARRILGQTAFLHKKDATNCCRLNEQSRMHEDICVVVANLFYERDLYVAQGCDRDAEWRARTSAPRIQSIGSANLHVARCIESGSWVTSNGQTGAFRRESAELAVAFAKECSSSKPGTNVVIITPFRKQRAVISSKLRSEGLRNVKVTTVHSVQGEEFHTIIFDPVLGEKIRPDGKLLSDEKEASRLINVALSRAQARFIVLLSTSDRENHWLARLENAIRHAEPSTDTPLPIEQVVFKPTFPNEYLGKLVSYERARGELVEADLESCFGILAADGNVQRFKTQEVRRIAAAFHETKNSGF